MHYETKMQKRYDEARMTVREAELKQMEAAKGKAIKDDPAKKYKHP